MTILEPIAYFRNRIVPASEAKLSVYDLGIVMGATITDMVRTYRHIPFRLDDHLVRFYESCKYARIQPCISPDETRSITQKIVQHNIKTLKPEEDLAIVYFITPGENPVYAGSAGGLVNTEPTFCIHTFRLPFSEWAHLLREGAHVVTPSIRHIPPQCTDPKIKCRSRIHWWLADQEARLVDPKAIPLLLDLDGNLTETGGANFIIVKEGTVISPTSRNILRGVSLKNVIELCAKLGIPFVERDIQVHDAINAEEALLTTTPYALAPVTKINGIPIGNGKPGPLFRRLANAWSEQVGMDILQQVLCCAELGTEC
ncbi:MAG TPA: aminotransferase class IV [Chthonomonadales bacterium]|nr:aminotransferase class IV [Chthonomonadales bacterium]